VAEGVRDLIREMSRANPRLGSSRIVGELAKLGIQVAKATVEKYMVRTGSRRDVRRGVRSLANVA
jgi:putative transposase